MKLPDVIEELWFKPVIWLIPLFWWNLSLKKRVEMFKGQWIHTLAYGLSLAVFYWFAFSQFKNLRVDWNLWGVAVATAVVEELVFSGFVTGYLERFQKRSFWNVFLSGAAAGVMRLPIATFVFHLSPLATLGVVMLAFATTMMHSWVRQQTGNVAGSMIARIGMNLSILS